MIFFAGNSPSTDYAETIVKRVDENTLRIEVADKESYVESNPGPYKSSNNIRKLDDNGEASPQTGSQSSESQGFIRGVGKYKIEGDSLFISRALSERPGVFWRLPAREAAAIAYSDWRGRLTEHPEPYEIVRGLQDFSRREKRLVWYLAAELERENLVVWK